MPQMIDTGQREGGPLVVHMLSAHRGQNDKDEVHVLEDGSAVLLQNLDVHRAGARSRRFGVSSLGGQTNQPGGLWSNWDNTLNREVLFGIYGGKVFTIQGGGTLAQRASGVSLTSALHMGILGRYAGRRATYILQGTNLDSDVTNASRIVAITDLNAFTQHTSAAIGGCWFQNRLWTGRQPYQGQNQESAWWSELGDGLSYSGFNSLAIEPGTGGNLVQIYPLRGFTPSLICFKERAVATLEPYWGSSSHLIPAAGDALDTLKTNIRLLTNTVGLAAPLSVQFVPGAPGGDLYFLARDGVRAITRAQDDTASGISPPISDPIQSTIDRINFTFAHKCVSAVQDSKYLLAVPLDGAVENTHVLIFDLQTQAWSITTWDPKTFYVIQLPGDTRDKLYMQYNTLVADCSNTAAYSAYHTYKCFSGLLDPGGEPIIFQEDSRGLNFGGIDKKKRWDWLSISFRNNASETCAIGVAYNVDRRGWVTAGSAVFGSIAGGLDTVLGETPLPWGVTIGATRTFKFGLNDIDPGYFIQIRYFGTSDAAEPVVLDMAVAAKPIEEEFDNSIT
jgi:hypothetical protein